MDAIPYVEDTTGYPYDEGGENFYKLVGTRISHAWDGGDFK
jgi:hypothetical protein